MVIETAGLRRVSTMAAQLGISRQSLYESLSRGVVRVYTIDGVQFVEESEINEWRVRTKRFQLERN
jgi:hypothetical protein